MKLGVYFLLITAPLLSVASAFAPHARRRASAVRTIRYDSNLGDQLDINAADDKYKSLAKGDEFKEIRAIVKELRDSSTFGEVKEKVLSEKDADVQLLLSRGVVRKTKRDPFMAMVPLAVAKFVAAGKVNETAATRKLDSFFGNVDDFLEEIESTEKEFVEERKQLDYDTYPKHPEYENVDLSSMMKMLKGIPPIEYFFSLRKSVRLVRRVLRIILGLAITRNDVEDAPTYEAKMKAFFITSWWLKIFDLAPLPQYTFAHWEDDANFARQFLTGVNPTMIEVIKDPESQVTSELKEQLSNEYNLAGLAIDGKLFKVDYSWLSDLKINPHQVYPEANNPGKPQDQPRYFQQAPQVILMVREPTSDLEIVAVQLEQQRGQVNKVYFPKKNDPEWMFVKACVANCDSQFHEWVSHLGKTHFTMEPHIVAIHNTLKKDMHPVYTFVRPMMKDTLLLNFAARRTLASYGADSFGDRITSVGTGQFMQLIKRYWKEYDFFRSSALEDELASRGFDENVQLDCYLYRQDGMRLWKAYGTFAAAFVNEIYQSDEDVATDKGLLEWALETSSKGKASVPGFPRSFNDKATLTKTLQTLWWICSGLHAAVNFPQYDSYAYNPNKPLGMREGLKQFQEAEQSMAGIREWIFSKAVPNLRANSEVITTVRLLTLPSEHTIDKLDDNFAKMGKQAYAEFKKELKIIGDDINKRNQRSKDAGEAVYPYLHPSVVPASIDI